MFELRKCRGCLRPWVAVVVAYALALQVLLSGFTGAHAMASGPLAGDLFVICHGSGDGAVDGQDAPDSVPLPTPPCFLCTLTAAPCALPPDTHSVATIDVVTASRVVARTEARVIQFFSPTGRYERGPPRAATIFG